MADQSPPPAAMKWIEDHVKLYLEDPDRGHLWDSTIVGGPGILPTLLLTTTGRKSGQSRILPLIYKATDGKFVIIASKGGAPEHPLWYENLVAKPDCHIQVGRDHFDVKARTAEGQERQDLWQQMAEVYPPYNDYQAATDREIPVVVLEPVA
jgi:deazaflavin-dependent oxidoreductase (nitroreductase family)